MRAQFVEKGAEVQRLQSGQAQLPAVLQAHKPLNTAEARHTGAESAVTDTQDERSEMHQQVADLTGQLTKLQLEVQCLDFAHILVGLVVGISSRLAAALHAKEAS